jgi:LPS-assembly lipoprotein
MLRRLSNAVVVGFLAVSLAGCLRPLYGSQENGGLAVQDGLSGIKIELEGERLAHYLRNELEFGLRGGNPDSAPIKYRLAITANQRTDAAVVDRLTGTAESGYMTIWARYVLYPIDKSTTKLTEGDARVLVSYDRSQQRFATIRAARDAEIQGAKQLAEQIKTRVATYLVSTR